MTRVPCHRLAVGDVPAAAFPDAFPASAAHTGIGPSRHTAGLLARREPASSLVWAPGAPARQGIGVRLHPGGDPLGDDIGGAAGQTVAHADRHAIPRDAGDVPDVRGGTRYTLPARAPHGARS